MITSARGLRRKLEWWKKELDINWDIELVVKPRSEMEGVDGRVGITEEKRMACIWLLDPRDTDPTLMRPYDPELTLVHELVHVMTPPFGGKPGDHRDIVAEQCVHAVSKALLKMARAARKGNSRCSIPTRRLSPKTT